MFVCCMWRFHPGMDWVNLESCVERSKRCRNAYVTARLAKTFRIIGDILTIAPQGEDEVGLSGAQDVSTSTLRFSAVNFK